MYDRKKERSLRSFAKQVAALTARLLVLPAACLAGFGRWYEPYILFAQAYAIAPGLLGSYLRIAYYRFTLDGVGTDCHMGFGSFFAHPQASIGDRVGIGAYCLLGQVDIGEGTQLAGGVQIVSGTKQHRRNEAGHLTDEGRLFRRISVGAHCWIGAGAIVLADVGEGATIGAGSVVPQDVPPGATVYGNPARSHSMQMKPVS